MKWGCWGHWGHRGCWGHWGCRGSKAWKITTEGFRLIQVLELSFIYIFLGKKIFGGNMKYQVGFKHLFCLRLLRSAYVTFLKTGCKYQNVITSGIYRTRYIYEIINPDTCKSQITLPISIWDTLYYNPVSVRRYLNFWRSHRKAGLLHPMVWHWQLAIVCGQKEENKTAQRF